VTFQDLRSVGFQKTKKLAIENNLYILDGTSHLYCKYISKLPNLNLAKY